MKRVPLMKWEQDRQPECESETHASLQPLIFERYRQNQRTKRKITYKWNEEAKIENDE
jgi:hypothetical protein